MMRRGWWWLAAPVVAISLGCTYAISYAVVRPYSGDDLPVGDGAGGPARVGQTSFLDLAIPARRDGAHITGVHANNVTPGLSVKFVSTTFARTGENQLSGFAGIGVELD